jgi:hypothetical protein
MSAIIYLLFAGIYFMPVDGHVLSGDTISMPAGNSTVSAAKIKDGK